MFLVATAILILRTRWLPEWLGWTAAILGPLLALAGWNFVLGPQLQYALYAVLLIVLLGCVSALGVMSYRRGP